MDSRDQIIFIVRRVFFALLCLHFFAACKNEFSIEGVRSPQHLELEVFLNSAGIPENSNLGSTIGVLTTSEDASGEITFSLVSGHGDNSSFIIDGNELKTANIIPNHFIQSAFKHNQVMKEYHKQALH